MGGACGADGGPAGPHHSGDDSESVDPLAIVVYLFVLDWRMALVSLLTIPVGILCYMAEMKEYPKSMVRSSRLAIHRRHHGGVHQWHRGHKGIQSERSLLWQVHAGRAAECEPHAGLDEESTQGYSA